MPERYEYFVDLVLLAPLDLLSLGSNAADLGHKGFRLVASAPVRDQKRGACLLLFWERPQRGASGGETAGPINENEEPDTSGRDRSH